jgi:hypothetical protein
VIVDDLRFDEYQAGGHPYLERRNVANDSNMAGIRSRMRAELARLVVEAIGLKVQ